MQVGGYRPLGRERDRGARAAPLTLAVDGATFSLVREGGTLRCREGPAEGALVATLDRQSASELLQDQASTFGLLFDGRAQVSQPDRDAWLLWEPALRAALEGRPVYEPGSVSFRDRHGDELDLYQHFDLTGPLDDAGHFLAEAGFLDLPGVFSTGEMAAVAEDLVACSAAARPDDGDSWWAETGDGPYPSRILRFAEKSQTLHGLLVSDRFKRIRSLVDDALADTTPSAEGLHKKVGVKKGISDVSWHKDCSLGGHSRVCSTMVVGISITGAGRVNGELGVVAGSNRANVAPIGAPPEPRPSPDRAPDRDRRSDDPLLLHAAHEPSAGQRAADGRPQRLQPRAASGRHAAHRRRRRGARGSRQDRQPGGEPRGNDDHGLRTCRIMTSTP